MKKLILLILCLATIAAIAQNAQVKVGYDYDFYDPRGIIRHHDYILLAGNQNSKFYNCQTQWLDSVRCTQEGEQWYVQQGLVMMAELMNKPRDERDAILNSSSIGRPVGMYAVRDGKDFKIWDEIYFEFRKYTEPVEKIDWKIAEDSSKFILDYECFMATANFHGRQWEAWFTPDIAVMSGPWKLQGLPGLILEASDSTQQHHFTANGIESVNIKIPEVYEPFEYENTTRIEFLKLCRFRYDNPQGMRDLHFGGTAGKLTRERIELEMGKDGYDFLETDYK